MSFIPLLQAGGGNYFMLVTLGLVFVIFYFFMIAPQKREQKKTKEMLQNLQKGDKVITIGGFHGVVSSTKENTVIIKIDETCKVEINRTAIASVIRDEKKDKFMPEAPAPKSPFSLFGKKKDDGANKTSDKTSDKTENNRFN